MVVGSYSNVGDWPHVQFFFLLNDYIPRIHHHFYPLSVLSCLSVSVFWVYGLLVSSDVCRQTVRCLWLRGFCWPGSLPWFSSSCWCSNWMGRYGNASLLPCCSPCRWRSRTFNSVVCILSSSCYFFLFLVISMQWLSAIMTRFSHMILNMFNK